MNNYLKFILLPFIFFSGIIYSQIRNRESPEEFQNYFNAKKSEGRNALVTAINNRLKKDEFYLMDLTEIISDNNLVECLPTLESYIENCDRNQPHHFEYALTVLAKFKSDDIQKFILKDFNNFLNSEKQINSSQEIEWLRAYIDALIDLDLQDSYDLVLKSYKKWDGIDENFGKFPRLFEIKKELEEEFKNSNSEKLLFKGFKIQNIMAFIKNTSSVIDGQKPIVDYIIEIELPFNGDYKENWGEKEDNALDTIQNITQLKKENITLVYNNGTQYKTSQCRLHKVSLFSSYLAYVTAFPSSTSKILVQEIYNHKYYSCDYCIYEQEKFLGIKQ